MKDGARTKVVLLDGTVTDTWSEGWRLECMRRNDHVQHVLGLLGASNRGRREAYYAQVCKFEGAEAEKRVRAAVENLWKAERANREARAA